MPTQSGVNIEAILSSTYITLTVPVADVLAPSLMSSLHFKYFLTGPAGCSEAFVIKLLTEIYTRYTNNDGYCQAYITCASTGKAAVAILGMTAHAALKISLSRLLPLHSETAQQCAELFKYIKVIIIDEISMISAQLLLKVDSRLKQITGNLQSNFGGIDIILIGDLYVNYHQFVLSPSISNRNRLSLDQFYGENLEFYELNEVMRQANQQFPSILTKIGNGEQLDEIEITLIESRFCTVEEVELRCPQEIYDYSTITIPSLSIIIK
ncbi:ATP-dependent DNA helicase [Trichonephila clavipes]|nr:ATP-dependent DNA helicase [Trichonephila clavipes]